MVIDIVGLMIIAVVSIAGYAIINLIPMEATVKRILLIVFSIMIFFVVLQSLGIYNSGSHIQLKTP